MKYLWYHIVKFYVRIVLFFTIKRQNVFGRENIPKTEPVIFIANHQNALIDALLIPATNKRSTYFLARASAFKNGLVKHILNTVNMLPIYRLRDGYSTLKHNQSIFKKCASILNKNKTLEIFAEGEHHLYRKVLPLKNGFVKIAELALSINRNLPLKIVPVGLNYNTRLAFPQSVSIYYGKPISVNNFLEANSNKIDVNLLKKTVFNSLINLTTNINDTENYHKIEAYLNTNKNIYLTPEKCNEYINRKHKLNLKKPTNNPKLYINLIGILLKINFIIPLFIWKYFKSKITDKIFTNTYRFMFIGLIYPIFCLFQSYLIYLCYSFKWSIIYIAINLLLATLYKFIRPINS